MFGIHFLILCFSSAAKVIRKESKEKHRISMFICSAISGVHRFTDFAASGSIVTEVFKFLIIIKSGGLTVLERLEGPTLHHFSVFGFQLTLSLLPFAVVQNIL